MFLFICTIHNLDHKPKKTKNQEIVLDIYEISTTILFTESDNGPFVHYKQRISTMPVHEVQIQNTERNHDCRIREIEQQGPSLLNSMVEGSGCIGSFTIL